MPGIVAKLSNGKCNHFGVEVVKGLTWEGWQPGREYTKNLVLKNVRVKTLKLKYKDPKTRFFTTLYPQPIVLSAGTSYTLPITFRPLERVVYNDAIEFSTNEGTFSVPISAVLPQVNIELPEMTNFDMCAAHDNVQLTLDIKNLSELVTPFQVDCPEPFVVEPSEGTLEPFASYSVTATFIPKAAVVYEANVVVRYGDDLSEAKITKFEGTGKYPHLIVRSIGPQAKSASKTRGEIESVVNFGTVAVGRVAEKWIELHNLSPVNAPFTVEHPRLGPSSLDMVFTCSQKEGVVPAQGSMRIPVSFSPNTINSSSIDYFHVKAIGNISRTIVTCMGSSKGPSLALSRTSINFHQVDSGAVATKTIDVINDTDIESTFQLDCSESMFEFELTSGTLPARSKKTIIVQFAPVHPINYYRRVTCLIHNQDPLYLDVLGTCHSETRKPAVLQVKHIKRFQVHEERGLSFMAPEQLNDMLKEGKLSLDEDGSLFTTPTDGSSPAPPHVTRHPLPMDEYFNDGYHSDVTTKEPHVSMDSHEAHFGRCADIRNIESKTINITNHTKGKITVAWMGGGSSDFTVTPAEVDLPPLKSSSFRVTFTPKAPNQFYTAELECYAYYKSLRDYRLVEDTTHAPPWCVTLNVTGHTFQSGSETFLPRFNLDSSSLTFPAVNSNESTYRSLLLSNTGSTPILYDFEKSPKSIFSMKPARGMLRAGSHQVFIVKCLPTEVKTYKENIKLLLNDMEKNTQEILMHGSAEAPDILLDNKGTLYFKPTCIGAASKRKYAVKNISRIPLCFEWHFQHKDGEMLSVEPATGIIQPNESQYYTWTFKPTVQDKFLMKPSLIVWGQGQSSRSSGGKKRQFVLRAIGEGSLGELIAEQTYTDYGTIVVGSVVAVSFVIMNEGDCTLHYSLNIDQSISGPYPEEQTRCDPSALELETTSGMIPARSRRTVNGFIRPVRRVYYQWAISCNILTPEVESGSISDVQESRHLCHILATGVYPTMSVTDARCYGSAAGISKKTLWNLFNLDSLNISLDADPSPSELQYNLATRGSHTRRTPVHTRSVLDCNFSAAPVGSEPCVIQLMFENTGAVAAEWNFLFPSDLQSEMDYWAETGEFDEDELHELKVMDNKLFKIEPQSGVLEPGDCCTLTFTYLHTMAGTDRLPVLLKLSKGREIMLNFIGVTVEPGRRYLHFPSNKHMFAPAPIGQPHNSKQVYELYNGGSLPVKYELDLAPLKALQQENFNHSILECLNPVGEVLPGQTANIEWKFNPLEAKTYMVDVPIHLHNSDSALVTFSGVGYDKRVLGETMPISEQAEATGVPSVQSVPLPGQLCFLSEERVMFGNIPLFSRSRKVVTISNRSREHAVRFVWHVTSKRDAKFVNITPSKGHLEPGDGSICKVTFTARGFPSFYDLDLICEVTNMTEYNVFRQQSNEWQAERERQQVEFTITEDDINADHRIPPTPDVSSSASEGIQSRITSATTIRSLDSKNDSRPPSGRLKSLDVRTPSPETELTRYRTLPPIKQRSVDEMRQEERQMRKFNEKFWVHPEPPKPFLLHLGITARTHDIKSFQDNFPDEYKNFCIDRTLCSGQKQEDAPSRPPQKISCLQSEADTVSSALSNIIRGLLDDSTFHESCKKVMNEPIPYFIQYTEKKPPNTTHSSVTVSVQVDSPAESAREEASSVMSKSDSEGTPLPTDEQEVEERAPSSAQKLEEELASVPQTPEELRSFREEKEKQDKEENKFTLKQSLKKLPEFCNSAENILENTIMNIIQEAFSQEFNITTRPRLVALLPRNPTPQSSLPSNNQK